MSRKIFYFTQFERGYWALLHADASPHGASSFGIVLNQLSEAQSDGDSTLAASQTTRKPDRKAPQAVAMSHQIEYNASQELTKGSYKGQL